MKQCKICLDADSCSFDWRDPDCEYMNCTEFKKPPPTNADRIRAKSKSDEGLADLLSRSMCSLCVLHHYCKENRNNRNCDDVILEWLKQECE